MPAPGLAEWTFSDPTTLVLDIRKDVTFHDGTSLDAEAVKFNLDRNRGDARSNIKSDLANIDTIEVTGPLQVTIKLKGADTALPAILSDRAGMMVSPANIKALGDDTNRKPVGAGPWKFVSWADNENVIVTRNETYWREGQPKLDGIEFRIIPEAATALRSVAAGEQDMAFTLPSRLKPVIARTPELQEIVAPTLACLQIYFNYGRAPLDNPKVRQAINFAIDRNAFVAAGMGGLGEAAATVLPKAHWAYDESVAGLYPHDPDRARALLAEAGFKDGVELNLGSYSDQDWVLRSEIIQSQLEAVGFRVKFTRGTVADISGQFFGDEKKFDALLSLWTGRPDPSMTFSSLFGEGAFYNAGRGAEAELSELLQQSRSNEDMQSRAVIFGGIQRFVMENALFAPLAFQFELDALAARAKGYRPNLLGKPKFNDMHIAA
jgi:peptide/nickel transport system permease protein/peptide/nickel transport system substrate-binding protein